MEGQVNSLDNQTKESFFKVKQENAAYIAEIATLQKTIQLQESAILDLENKISKNPTKTKIAGIYEKIAIANEKKTELEEELKGFEKESAADEKARLLEQVRRENVEISSMERKIAELEEQIKKSEAVSSASELEDSPDKQEKYNDLIRKDKEIQEYLDTFDQKRHEVLTYSQTLENQIQQRLFKIKSDSLKLSADLPSTQGYQGLKDDLNYKERVVENSTNTIEALAVEKEMRLKDLDKVEQLEEKLKAEMGFLRSKIEELNVQTVQISNVEEFIQNCEKLNEARKQETKIILEKNQNAKLATKELEQAFNMKNQQLEENETNKQLRLLEKRLGDQEAVVFTMKDCKDC